MKLPSIFRNKRRVQYAAMFSGSFAAIATGVNLGWPSPYLPYLLSPQSHIPITADEGSWCAVLQLIGEPFGALATAYFLDIFGRKRCILSLPLLVATCFVMLGSIQSVLYLYIVRFLLGITDGALYSALPIYFGEISDPEIRGFMGTSVSVAVLTGNIFINCIGPFMTIRTSSFICCGIPLIHFIGFIWMPESPYFLLKKGDFKSAEMSLQSLRGIKDVGVELQELSDAVTRQNDVCNAKFADLVTVRSNRKCLLIYTILCFTNKFSGRMPVVFYTTMIFSSAAGSVDAVASAIIFSVIGLIATIAALLVVDRFGRRPLILFSGFGCSIALAVTGCYFTLQIYTPALLMYLGWLPITSLIAFNVIFSFGLSFAPVLFLSELFPISIKPKALCVAVVFSIIMATVASKFFQTTMDYFGMFVPFWTFAACVFVGSLFLYLHLPETKGKTLEQIQLELLGRRKLIKI